MPADHLRALAVELDEGGPDDGGEAAEERLQVPDGVRLRVPELLDGGVARRREQEAGLQGLEELGERTLEGCVDGLEEAVERGGAPVLLQRGLARLRVEVGQRRPESEEVQQRGREGLGGDLHAQRQQVGLRLQQHALAQLRVEGDRGVVDEGGHGARGLADGAQHGVVQRGDLEEVDGDELVLLGGDEERDEALALVDDGLGEDPGEAVQLLSGEAVEAGQVVGGGVGGGEPRGAGARGERGGGRREVRCGGSR